MFSLIQLHQFVAVAEELHFGRAAARLNMTQPPLSRQIQHLEKQLSVQLFDRSGGSVTLTPAGKAFLPDARRLWQESERATLSVQRASAGLSGLLRVGFTAGSVQSALAATLTVARAVIGDVKIELCEMVTIHQLEALSDGTLDLGLVRPRVTRPDIRSRSLVREPMIVALPLQHPLGALDRPIEVTDLHGIDMVMFDPNQGRYLYQMLSAVFQNASVSPNYVQYLSQTHSILGLVNIGWGVAVVPQSASKMRFDHVVYRELLLVNAPQARLDVVWRGDNPNPSLHRLLDTLDRDAAEKGIR